MPLVPRQQPVQQPVATPDDTFLVSGCPFTVGPKPQPCVTVQWTSAATRVGGEHQVLLQDSAGTCLSVERIPAGPPTVVTTQTRVKGT